MTLKIKLAPKNKATPGFYRICEEPNCPRLIPCPYVRCDEHRTDYEISRFPVKHLEPNEVEIISWLLISLRLFLERRKNNDL